MNSIPPLSPLPKKFLSWNFLESIDRVGTTCYNLITKMTNLVQKEEVMQWRKKRKVLPIRSIRYAG